jgi:uncharacterized protein YggE
VEGNNSALNTQPKSSSSFLSNLAVSIFALAFLLAAFYFFPFKNVKWGKVEFLQPETITVVGTAESKEKTQVATFTAGVSQVSDNKDEAVNFVNKKVQEIVDAALNFGIEKSDIKTENIYVFQQEESYWEDGRQKTRPGQWRVSNNVSIILRNVDRASEFSKVLSRTGATNIYGPSFSMDDTSKFESDLLTKAIDNAREKAQAIATSTNRKLGKVISVSEIGSPVFYPKFAMEGAGGGGGFEPGSSIVSKSVTVVFEVE